jgi:hypothetical protein
MIQYTLSYKYQEDTAYIELQVSGKIQNTLNYKYKATYTELQVSGKIQHTLNYNCQTILCHLEVFDTLTTNCIVLHNIFCNKEKYEYASTQTTFFKGMFLKCIMCGLEDRPFQIPPDSIAVLVSYSWLYYTTGTTSLLLKCSHVVDCNAPSCLQRQTIAPVCFSSESWYL